MRLGVLDVGSNTVHMLVVDAHPGGQPLPAFSHKVELSLAAHLEPDNTLSAAGEKRLTEVVLDALRMAEDTGVEDFLAFATSAVRDARNGDEVLARIRSIYGQYTESGGGTQVNLQGIVFGTNQGGRLPLEKYLDATVRERTTIASGARWP